MWFLDDNPIVGYNKLKGCIRLMFWSGMGFDEPDLQPGTGKIKDASIRYTQPEQIDKTALQSWLEKSQSIQWDYKNIYKTKGKLERILSMSPINHKPLHPGFEQLLTTYDENLVELYKFIRGELLQVAPDCNELLYNSHALTIAFSLSDKLSEAFCHLPIYKSHINLGFNQGAFLDDPDGLLQGTGKAIRHIKMTVQEDFSQDAIKLVEVAMGFAKHKMKSIPLAGKTISNLK